MSGQDEFSEYSEFKTSEHKPEKSIYSAVLKTMQRRTEQNQNILALVENKYVTVHPSHIVKFILMCTASGKDGLQHI